MSKNEIVDDFNDPLSELEETFIPEVELEFPKNTNEKISDDFEDDEDTSEFADEPDEIDNYEVEDEDDDEEEEDEAEAEEEPEDDKETLSKEDLKKYKSELSRLDRERHKFIHFAKKASEEAQALKNENDRLRLEKEQAYEAATQHYDKRLDLEFSSALNRHQEALEMGDKEEIGKSSADLARVTHLIEKAKDYAAQQRYETQSRQQQANSGHDQQNLTNIKHNAFNQWVSANPWLNKESSNYDEDLDRAASKISDDLDSELLATGRIHLQGMPEYFHDLNNRIRGYWQARQNSTAQKRKPVVMKKLRSPVAPVKSSGVPSKQSAPESKKLTKFEKSMISQMGEGFNIELYLKNKANKSPNKGAR